MRQQGQADSAQDPQSNDKIPQFNWLQHANAHKNFSCQDKFLSSNFLFSVPTKKPSSEDPIHGAGSGRFVDRQSKNIQSSQRAQFEKAWLALSSLQVSSRNYVQPGKTVKVASQFHNDRATSFQGSYERDKLSRPGVTTTTPNVINHSSRVLDSSSDNQTYTSRPFHEDMATPFQGSYENDKLRRSDVTTTPPTVINHNSRVLDSSANHTKYTSQINESTKQGPNDINADDDDILESIDVDQIVEKYQSSCTPQPSMSKFPPITPAADKDNFARQGGNLLPPELCLDCIHGYKLGLCPEAASHLQELKDNLISISNELLDNIENLSSMQIEKLRQDRSQLNKQIQQLEKYIHSSNLVDERQKSHFSTSMATPSSFVYETPLQNVLGSAPNRYDAQAYMGNGTYGSSHQSLSYFPADNCGLPSGPVAREAFIPKIIEVNYIEGSGDKRWSSRDFPWTKKLEVDNKKVFGNHSFRPNQREVINATMSGCDVFVLMPTGGGKSLTYQLPALICPGITLVISPLVSLIQDQIMHLLQANIPATYLSANMEWTEQQEILRELNSDYCKYKLLYVTFEKVAR